MTDLAALDELIKAVKTGEFCMLKFPWWQWGHWFTSICHSYHGDLSAAKALHEALPLRGWAWSIDSMGQAMVWYPHVEGDAITFEAVDSHKPARALLLCFLCAYRAQIAEKQA